jgi:hypothetical protein
VNIDKKNQNRSKQPILLSGGAAQASNGRTGIQAAQ